MGYGYGVWLVFGQGVLSTSHIAHVTISCFLSRESASLLAGEIQDALGGPAVEVVISGDSVVYPSNFYDNDAGDLVSWGYNVEMKDPTLWDTLRDISEPYEGNFTLYPHASVEYARVESDLTKTDMAALNTVCRIMVADIRHDEPVMWKTIS